MGAGHPECPERLDAIEDRLLISGLDVALERREATAASLADLELAHGRMHLAALRGLCESLKEDISAGGPTEAPPATAGFDKKGFTMYWVYRNNCWPHATEPPT